jgi:Ser/Thr protein kinase RdoA (MazF antagonist)
VLRTAHGDVVFNWTASGRGPRLADLAWLLRVSWGDATFIEPAVEAYCHHVEVTEDELDRLEEVMYIRTLYLDAFGYRRSLANGHVPEGELRRFSDPGNTRVTADSARAAIRRQPRPTPDGARP